MKFGGRAVHSGSETLRIRGWRIYGGDGPLTPWEPTQVTVQLTSLALLLPSPAPKSFLSWGGWRIPPGAPPWVPSSAQGTARHPGSPPPPPQRLCYLTTHTGIQREPPSDPHPESRRPRWGVHHSKAAGNRVGERPGHAEVK